ncbi:MAG: hypothetical protein M1836_007922 [Candelina mexicana]|nr:MAG: hypothetical protein M1836_007922 [Candelina mexicana]
MSFLPRSYLPSTTTTTTPPPPEPSTQSSSPATSEHHQPNAPTPTTPPPHSRSPLPLFLAGLTFTSLSLLLTRRTLHRRHLALLPKFYNPPYHPLLGPSYPSPHTAPVNGAVEAIEALSIASVNVASFGLLVVGGGLWWWDVRGLEDLRGRVRRGMGVSVGGEGDAEEEMEEWIAGVLRRKEGKVERGRRRRREEEEDE